MPTDRLSFDEFSHRYLLDGKPIPSVTQILKALGVADDKWFRAEHSERGIAVHEAIALLNAGKLDWGTVDSRIEGYLWAWETAKDDLKAEIVESEVMLYHPQLLYAGRIDALARIDNQLVVLDYKTGASTPAEQYQLSGYIGLAQANGRDVTYTGRVVHLKKDGTYSVKQYRDHVVWQGFVSLVNTYNILTKLGRIGDGEGSGGFGEADVESDRSGGESEDQLSGELRVGSGVPEQDSNTQEGDSGDVRSGDTGGA